METDTVIVETGETKPLDLWIDHGRPASKSS